MKTKFATLGVYFEIKNRAPKIACMTPYLKCCRIIIKGIKAGLKLYFIRIVRDNYRPLNFAFFRKKNCHKVFKNIKICLRNSKSIFSIADRRVSLLIRKIFNLKFSNWSQNLFLTFYLCGTLPVSFFLLFFQILMKLAWLTTFILFCVVPGSNKFLKKIFKKKI